MPIKLISSPAPAGNLFSHTADTRSKADKPSAGGSDLKPRSTASAGSSAPAQQLRNLVTKALHAGRAHLAKAPAALPPDAIVESSRETLDRVLSLDRRAPIPPPLTDTGAAMPGDAGLQLRKAQQAAGLLQVACSEAQRLEARLTHLLGEAGQLAEAPGYKAQLKEAASAIASAMKAAVAAGPGGKAPIPEETITHLTQLNASFDKLAREVPGSAVHLERRDTLRQALEVAGRVHGNLQTLATQAQAGVAAAQAEAVRQHGQQVQQIAGHPPGFTAGPQQAALRDLLLAQTQGLPGPAGTGALTQLDVLQLAVPALSVATGGDAARAQAALKQLATQTLQDWVPRRGAGTSPADGAADDVRTLMRLMNHLPRGLEAVSLMARHDGQPPSPTQLDIIGTYWNAEEVHQQASPDEQTRPARAMAMAQYMLRPDPAARPAPADQAAYTAVRSGLHSSARYEQVNQRLEQAFSAWIDSGAKAPHWLPPLHIRHNLTPFEGKTLDLGAHAAAEIGLFTGATEANEKVRAVAGQLLAQVPAGNGERELALRAVLSHLEERETADVAGQKLTASDINAIATRLTDTTRAATRHGSPDSRMAKLEEKVADLRDKATELAQDGLDKAGTRAHLQAHGQWLGSLAKPGDMPGQVLERVLAEVASKGTGKGLEPIQQALQQARRAERSAGVHQIQSGEDLGRTLAPLMDHLKQGDSLELQGGANTGVSLPYVPLGMVGPVRLTLSGAYHHERDAKLEIKRDPTGILISVGHADLREGEAQLTAGAQFGVDPAGAAVTAGVREVRSKQDTEALILRVPDRGDEQALHHEASALLHDLTTWHQQASAQAPGTARKDLLSTVLERHENLDVIDMSHTTRTSGTMELSLKAGVMFDIPVPLQIGSYKAGPVTNLTYARRHETSQRTDTGGHDRVETQQSATTAQRLTLHAGLSLPGASALYSKDLYQAEERNTMTATTIGGHLDVEFERQSLSPKQLLAELGTQREAWLARAMEHNKSAPAGQGGSAGQELAVQQLDSFIREVRQLAEDKPKGGRKVLHSFVINQTLSVDARTAVEVLEARGRVATLRDDKVELAQIGQERQQILAEPSSRQPGALLVISHRDESASKGLGAVAIAQRKSEAEARHVAAQFPPETQAEAA